MKKSYGAFRSNYFQLHWIIKKQSTQLNENTPVTMEKLKERLTILFDKEKLLNKPHGPQQNTLWIYYINEHTPLKEIPKGYLCSLYD